MEAISMVAGLLGLRRSHKPNKH